MRFWWVNQNQTYRHEVGGGYLWSPKRRKDGARHPFYESMREVAPGDLIFSFCDTYIAAIGFAQSYSYESPKPEEFGTTGLNWSQVGWRVDVRFQELARRIRPKDFIAEIVGYLPKKYSPLTREGNGLQSVYLTEMGELFAGALMSRIGDEARSIRDRASTYAQADRREKRPDEITDEWEERIEAHILHETTLTETERKSLVLARRGQGRFRSAVEEIETSCRITRVSRREHLVASHTKPWRDASNEERLDGENGLLLTPSIDHLFDKGFISFEDKGRLLISPVADRVSLKKMGVPIDVPFNVGTFSSGQRHFLEYHREQIFKQMIRPRH